jgi:hypothetical protein
VMRGGCRRDGVVDRLDQEGEKDELTYRMLQVDGRE